MKRTAHPAPVAERARKHREGLATRLAAIETSIHDLAEQQDRIAEVVLNAAVIAPRKPVKEPSHA
jgi:hypothetical protein